MEEVGEEPQPQVENEVEHEKVAEGSREVCEIFFNALNGVAGYHALRVNGYCD